MPPGRSLLVLSPAGDVEAHAFNTARWEDILPTLEAASSSPDLLARVLATARLSTNVPSRYLSGLILTAQGKPAEALDLFLRIPSGEIPADHLYAPYRLHLSLGRGDDHPFRAPMLAAISNRLVNPLVEARVMAYEGQLAKALESYLKTDPGTWVEYDREALAMMRNQAGITREVDRMVLAALRGGRLQPDLAQRLQETLTQAQAHQEQVDGIRALLATNEPLRTLASAGAVKTIETRRDFLSGDYAALLERHRRTDPAQLTDEHVIVLVLASARQSDRVEFGRWSRELRRRFPQNEVATWLKQLENDIK